jgi:RHS repeat-associated protein
VCTGPSCVTNTTYYLNDPSSGAMSEKATAGATTTWRDYLSVDGKIIAERFLPVGGAASWKFFVLDHLGSIAVVADSAGTVSENLAYDAWGRRRSATDGSDLSQCTVTSVTTRGFINQEQMDGGVCLDNLNARIYDPTLGRFLSADPMIGDPYTPQQLNRYTYSLNNPLSLSDPNGLCFLGCFYRNPVVQTVIAIAIAALVPYAFPEEWAAFGAEVGIGTLATEAVAVAAGGALSGAATAGMNGGNILRGMLSGAFEALAFFRVGGYVDGLEAADATAADIPNALLRIGLHGLVGGIASSINKGNFGAGFLAAGFGAAADSVPTEGMAEGTVVHAVAGGVGSVLGGGKFENGAITGAFGYLFNKVAHQVSLRDTSYLDRYYDEVKADAVTYGVDPSLVMGVGIESGFASNGTYLRTGDAFGMTGGSTAHMEGFSSPQENVDAWFRQWGGRVNGVGKDANLFVNRLEGEDAAGHRIPGELQYNSYHEVYWKDLIRSGIGQMRMDVPVYFLGKKSK